MLFHENVTDPVIDYVNEIYHATDRGHAIENVILVILQHDLNEVILIVVYFYLYLYLYHVTMNVILNVLIDVNVAIENVILIVNEIENVNAIYYLIVNGNENVNVLNEIYYVISNEMMIVNEIVICEIEIEIYHVCQFQ